MEGGVDMRAPIANLFVIGPCREGDVKLITEIGSASRAGIVLACVNGRWGKVCGGVSDPFFASVVCKQLGYSPYGE